MKMYTYILLAFLVAASATEGILAKEYDRREESNSLLFALTTALGALIFWLIKEGNGFCFDIRIVPYSLGFAASYGAALVGILLAIHYGPYALTMLISSYSLIIPTLYGIIMLHEKIKLTCVAGIIFLLVSLALVTARKGERVKFSLAWIISIFIGFIGNGMCSTVQKMQQLRFSGGFKSEFMAIALFAAIVVLLCCEIARKDINRTSLTGCLKYGLPKGIINGLINLVVMILTPLLPNVVLFPSISAGGIVTAYFVSRFLYAEKLTRIQNIGFILGVFSIVLLNI